MISSFRNHNNKNNRVNYVWVGSPIRENVECIYYDSLTVNPAGKYPAFTITRGSKVHVRPNQDGYDPPWIAEIVELFYDKKKNEKSFSANWLYRYEDVSTIEPRIKQCLSHELYYTNHQDCNPVETIQSLCYVLFTLNTMPAPSILSANNIYFTRYMMVFNNGKYSHYIPISEDRIREELRTTYQTFPHAIKGYLKSINNYWSIFTTKFGDEIENDSLALNQPHSISCSLLNQTEEETASVDKMISRSEECIIQNPAISSGGMSIAQEQSLITNGLQMSDIFSAQHSQQSQTFDQDNFDGDDILFQEQPCNNMMNEHKLLDGDTHDANVVNEVDSFAFVDNHEPNTASSSVNLPSYADSYCGHKSGFDSPSKLDECTSHDFSYGRESYDYDQSDDSDEKSQTELYYLTNGASNPVDEYPNQLEIVEEQEPKTITATVVEDNDNCNSPRQLNSSVNLLVSQSSEDHDIKDCGVNLKIGENEIPDDQLLHLSGVFSGLESAEIKTPSQNTLNKQSKRPRGRPKKGEDNPGGTAKRSKTASDRNRSYLNDCIGDGQGTKDLNSASQEKRRRREKRLKLLDLTDRSSSGSVSVLYFVNRSMPL